jgi:glycosyltransferase involved in cell wall biosynthesis
LQHLPYGPRWHRALSIARARRLDIVHVHYAVPHVGAQRLADRRHRSAAGRDHPPWERRDANRGDPAYLETTRFAVERSDGVTVPSAYLKEEAYRRLLAGREIDVIPNFVDTARFVPPLVRDRAWLDVSSTVPPVIVAPPSFSSPASAGQARRTSSVLARLRQRIKARLVIAGDGPNARRSWRYVTPDSSKRPSRITRVADDSARGRLSISEQSESSAWRRSRR